MLLKGDLVNNGYKEVKIWGITSSPTPDEKAASLEKLEDFCAEFEERDMCLGYNFEDKPDLNSPAGIKRGYKDAVQVVLGSKLLDQFGKPMTATFKLKVDAAYSFLVSATAQVNEVQYSSRQPLGSGNTNRYGNTFRRKFYPEVENVPADCETRALFNGAVEDYTEHYDSFLLGDAEDISSYVITTESGITSSNEVLDTPDVTYRITATEVGVWKLKIVATTTTGRVTTRFYTFVINDSDI